MMQITNSSSLRMDLQLSQAILVTFAQQYYSYTV